MQISFGYCLSVTFAKENVEGKMEMGKYEGKIKTDLTKITE